MALLAVASLSRGAGLQAPGSKLKAMAKQASPALEANLHRKAVPLLPEEGGHIVEAGQHAQTTDH